MTRHPTVSVLLPCFDNSDSLHIALAALEEQAIRAEEVICVSDHSSAREEAAMRTLGRQFSARFFSLPQGHYGRSAARNLGTACSRGQVLLYLDPDMVPGPGYVAAVKAIHQLDFWALARGRRFALTTEDQLRGSEHCLQVVRTQANSVEVTNEVYRSGGDRGQVVSLPPSLAAFWLLGQGQQLSRRGLLASALLTGLERHISSSAEVVEYSPDWPLCASNNLSVRRCHVDRAGGWDEGFKGWGEEDLELAYRLVRLGCRPILPREGPLYAYHLEHETSEANMDSLRANARHFLTKHPEVADVRAPAYRHFGISIEEILG